MKFGCRTLWFNVMIFYSSLDGVDRSKYELELGSATIIERKSWTFSWKNGCGTHLSRLGSSFIRVMQPYFRKDHPFSCGKELLNLVTDCQSRPALNIELRSRPRIWQRCFIWRVDNKKSQVTLRTSPELPNSIIIENDRLFCNFQ